MAVTPFATPLQVENRSRGAVTAATHPGLSDELAAATVAIQNACGWHIAPVQSIQYVRAMRSASLLFLPASQIGAVTALTINGVVLDDLTLLEVDPLTGETNVYGRLWDVTFTAGYAEVPADLVALTCDMVTSALGGTAEGLAREQAGAVSVTYRELAEAELDSRLAAYRLGRVP